MIIKAFTLSTCPFCRAFKRFMQENNLPFEYVDVDLLEGEEREAALREAYSYCSGCGYPIIIIDGKVISGFDEQRLRGALEL
ncbi:MAG: glutaredoxin family protein [Candidatus Hydrothermarchaeales archaeon]